MPSMANPLGIGNRCMPLATKVQNLLIADFLNYLAMRHQVYLSTMDEVLKKLQEQALTHDGIIDPLADLDVDIQSFDIPRIVSVYPDRAGVRWWTKAWFNGKEEGNPPWRLRNVWPCSSSTAKWTRTHGWRNTILSRWRYITMPSSRQRNRYYSSIIYKQGIWQLRTVSDSQR